MYIHKILFLSLLLFFLATVGKAQGSAADKSPTAQLEWAALEKTARQQPTEAAALYQKAAELAQSQNNEMQFYYRYYQGLAVWNSGDQEGAKAIFETNKKQLAATQKDKTEWNCFALMAEYTQKKGFDSQAATADVIKKMIALNQNWTETPANTLPRALFCYQLAEYHSRLQQAETTYKYILQAYNLVNTPALKYSYRGVEIQHYFILGAMYADMINSSLQTLNNELIRFAKANIPQFDRLRVDMVRNNYMIADIKNDTAALRRTELIYTQTANECLPPTAIAWATYYNDIGMVAHTKFNNPQKALAYALKGIAILETLNSSTARTDLGISCNQLAKTFANPKSPAYNVAQALFFYKKAANALLRSEQQLKNEADFPDFAQPETYCHNDMIMLELMNGFSQLYFPAYEQSPDLNSFNQLLALNLNALALAERYRAKAETTADLSYWEGLYFKINKNLSEIYWVWYEKTKDKAALDKLLFYTEQYKAAKTRRHLNTEKALLLGKVSPAEIAALRQSKSEQSAFLLEYHQYTASRESKKASERLELYYQKTKELEGLQKSLEKNYPLYQKLNSQSQPITIAALQQELAPDMLMLCYFYYQQTDGILILSKDSAWVQKRDIAADSKLISWAAVAKLLKEPSQATAGQNTQKAILARNLYGIAQNLLPNETNWQKKGIQTLLIVPHSELSVLPFELLLTQPVTKDTEYRDFAFLIKKYAIQYSPAATLWVENKRASAQKTSNGRLLAFAPSYEPASATDKKAMGKNTPRAYLSELKGTVKELQNLENYYYGDYLYGKKANEAAFRTKIKANYSILHMAMHGLLHEDNPALSALVFSEQKGSAEDDFLNGAEVAQLQLNSQLVVLSACETAAGRLQQNEGAMSMARYFLYGAAPSVVATRWQVNDQTTAFIMQNFYKNLYEGQTISQAMRAAQLSYLAQAQGEAQEPFYWAAFMSVGDVDKPVYLAHKNWAYKYYLMIFLSIAVLSFGAWWYFRRYAVLR